MSGALFRAQQQRNMMENGVEIAFITVFTMIIKITVTGKIANCEK